MSSRNWLFALVLVVATLLVYQPAWNGKPIWDDEIHITAPALRSFHGLTRIWTDPSAAPQYYPLLHTIFWLEYKLWDGWPLPYHLLTILLHATLALLLLQILRGLEVPGAWLAAAIFALHPVHVESVAWFSEVKNTLSGVFAAAAALAYLKYDRDRQSASYLLALGLFVAGLMTKTAIVTLPVVLLVIFWWKRGEVAWKRDLKPLLPFFGLALVAGIVTVWVEQKFCAEHGETFDFSPIDRFLIAGRLFWFYLGKLFWPADLTIIYPRWQISENVWWQYLFPIAALALFIGLWIARRRSRAPLAALLCFVAMLFPVLGFFNLSYFMSCPPPLRQFAIFRADHFQYLADTAIIALIASGVAWLWARSQTRLRSVFSVGIATVLVLLGSLTWAQSRNYRDAENCFRDVLSKNPNSATAHNNLGNVLLRRGAVDEAIAHFKKALEIEPNYQFGQSSLGAALVRKGDASSAIPLLRSVLKADPNNPKANYSLADALAQTGQSSQAIAYYGRALQLAPDFVEAHTNLANLLLEKGEIDAALAHYRRAVELQPNDPGAHYNLAVGLTRKGDIDSAIAELRSALQLDPAYPDADPLLRNLLARKTQP
jgi:tetratricopeptide (TPR) repeat protein